MNTQEPQETNMVWKYTTTEGKEAYLLAPDLELAAWRASELVGGTHKLKDIVLHYD